MIGDLLDLGVKYYFSQTDPWTAPDDPKSRYPVTSLLAQHRAIERQGGRWGLVVHTAFPAYEESLIVKEGSVEWLSGERVPIWSPWDPDRLPWVAKKLAFLRGRVSALEALGVGILSEYGDASFFTGGVRRDAQQGSQWVKRFGMDPPLPGFWCGEPLAQTSWQAFLKAKYGDVEEAYRVWGMEASPRVPKPIGRGYPLPARLDFLDWYRSALPGLVSNITKVAREVFPEVPLMVPISPSGDSARLGVDVYSLVRAASGEGAIVKVGTVGYYPFALNWALSLGRVRASLQATGAYAWTEAPFVGEPGGIRQRLAESLALGAGGHIDWPQAYRDNKESLLFQLPLSVTKPVCSVAVIYPSSWAMLQGANPAPPGVLRILVPLRDYMDFDVLEESAVLQGALERYRVGVLVGGTIWKRETLKAIRDWVFKGGVLFGYDFGKMEDPTGDVSVHQELFGYASNLTPAQPRFMWVGEIPPHYQVLLGTEGDEELLSGRWGPGESGGRLAYESAFIRLPVEAGSGVVVSVQFAEGQEVSQNLVLRVGGSVVAEVEPGKELGVLEFPVGPELTERGWLDISFEGLEGSGRVRVSKVTIRRPGAGDPPAVLSGYFEDPINPEVVKNSWSRKFGKGLVIFMPGKGELWQKYISLVCYGVSHLFELDPGRYNIRVLDGARNRVYATECSEWVLYYNDSSREVSLQGINLDGVSGEVKVPPKQFVMVPRRPAYEVFLTWGEPSEGAPSVRVSQRGGQRVNWDARGRKVRASEPLRFRVNLPSPGRYRVFMRTLVGDQLVGVRVQMGEASAPATEMEKRGAFLFVGEFDFPKGEMEGEVSADFDFVLEGFVLTGDLRVLGYRLVGFSAGTAN